MPTTGNYAREGEGAHSNALNGAAFIGWWSNGVEIGSASPSGDFSITGVFGLPFTIRYNGNGATSGSMSDETFYYGVESYKPQGNIAKNEFKKTNFSFIGWNTRKTPTAANPGIWVSNKASAAELYTALSLSPGDTKTLYAQWSDKQFHVNVTRVNSAVGGESPNEIGRLKIRDITNDKQKAYSDSGSLTYDGTVDGSTYRIYCLMDSTKPDVLWNAVGIDGSPEYIFTPTGGTSVTKNFVFARKPLYSMSLVCVPNTCTAAISSPSEVDDAGKYVSGRNIVINTVPAFGYVASYVAASSGRSFGEIVDNTINYTNIASDETLTITFEKEVYSASVEIDSASVGAISSVSVRKSTEESGVSVEEYDIEDSLYLSAAVASGYSFGGWYVDGVLRSDITPRQGHPGEWVVPVGEHGDKTFVAKAKVSVSMTAVGRSISPTSDPSVQPVVTMTGVTDGYVTLGDGFSYVLSLNGWNFNAWFTRSDPQTYTDPLLYQQSGTIVPTDSVDVIADCTDVPVTNTLTVEMYDDEIPQGQSVRTNISKSGVISILNGTSGGWVPGNPGHYAFVFTGTSNVTLVSAPVFVDTSGGSQRTFAFKCFADSNFNTLSDEREFGILTQTRTIKALYTTGGTRTITLSYGTSQGATGDQTMGTFEFFDIGSGSVSDDGRTVTEEIGSTVGIRVKPKNGYRFMGWYTRQEVGGDPYLTGSESLVVVTTNLDLYAWFAQDTNAVYIWEGSGDSKSLEWRSKTYSLARPANMSCCRVDSEGYPIIELDIDMFSAPDAEPTETVSLENVSSQDARRLPFRRPERFMQVCVKNDSEVDSIIVGTNMTELAQ